PYSHLVEMWLWSKRQGVLSEGTALGLHGVIALQAWPVYMTVPKAWKKRRLRVPGDVVLRFKDLAASDWGWHGPVPVTTTRRAMADNGMWQVSIWDYPEVIARARARNLLDEADVRH